MESNEITLNRGIQNQEGGANDEEFKNGRLIFQKYPRYYDASLYWYYDHKPYIQTITKKETFQDKYGLVHCSICHNIFILTNNSIYFTPLQQTCLIK